MWIDLLMPYIIMWCSLPSARVERSLAANVLPQNAKEFFNIRHSSLHNIVERLYGVVQASFPILRDMPNGDAFDTRIVMWDCHVFSSTTLLVGIRMRQIFFGYFEEVVGIDSQAYFLDIEELEEGGLNYIAAKAWRLGIADEMWADWPVVHRL